MNFPDYFCDHLNQAKELVRSNVLDAFPIAYSKSRGFVKYDASDSGNMEDLEIFLSDTERDGFSSDRCETLHSDCLYAHFSGNLESEILNGLRLFGPLVFAPLMKRETPFIIAHMAQTLDGKICTNNGDSKWIGNTENLKHAHRVRAMVDGVMVGGNTVANDLPRLNVRHVKGANPVRLLLSNTFNEFEKLPETPGMKTFLLRRIDNPVEKIVAPLTKVIYYDGETQKERIDDLLKSLKQEGIGSILLEGGPSTLTSFYSENKIDKLQIHIAPMIFGSGKSFIQLSEIKSVSDGRILKNVFYNAVGDGMMITGELS